MKVKPSQERSGGVIHSNFILGQVAQAFSKNCLPASLFKKLLERKPDKYLSLRTLSPNPIRRDHNPFEKRLDRKVLFDLKPQRRA